MSTDLSKIDGKTGLPAELADLYQQASGEGMENVSSRDIVIPRIAVMQSNSPLVNDREANVRAGDIANIQTKENYGEVLSFYPILFWTSRICFESRDPGSSIECQALDGEHGTQHDEKHGMGVCANCPQSQWINSTDPNIPSGARCTEFKNVLVLPLKNGVRVQDVRPAAVSAKRTGIKPFKEFLSIATNKYINGNQVPLYGIEWVMKTIEVQNSSGQRYYVPKFVCGDYITDVKLFKYLRQMYQEAKDARDRFVIQQDNADDTVDPVAAETRF